MPGIEIWLTARTEDEFKWADMEPETQVIYALVREAIENAGYKLEEMEIGMMQVKGSSMLTCKVNLRCSPSCSHYRASTDGSGC